MNLASLVVGRTGDSVTERSQGLVAVCVRTRALCACACVCTRVQAHLRVCMFLFTHVPQYLKV